MEAADDAMTGVPPLGGLVVGAENQVAEALGGSEEGGLGQRQQVKIAECGELCGGVGTQALAQLRGVAGVREVEGNGISRQGSQVWR